MGQCCQCRMRSILCAIVCIPRYKAEFFSDYSYHAQMEPLNAVARFNAAGDRVEVWDGSQDVAQCRALVAKTLGLTTAQVEVNQCFMGGAFGRRSLSDYTAEAVE